MNATTIQQQQQNIVAGDWEHLAKVLRSSGISEPELDELSTAVKADGVTLGTRVKGWIGKTAPKVLSGRNQDWRLCRPDSAFGIPEAVLRPVLKTS